MPTPRPIIAPIVGAAVETSSAPASSDDAAQAGGDGHERERDRDQGGNDRAEGDDQHDQRREEADRLGAGGLCLALMNAASPPSSADSPSVSAGAIASATAATAAGPRSCDGTSNVISA